jgi:hypothetical protein
MVPFWVELLDEEVSNLLIGVYSAPEPVPVDRLVEVAWSIVQEEFYVDDLEDRTIAGLRRTMDWNIRLIMSRLERLGAVTVNGVEVETDQYGFSHESGGQVRLTPLGLRGVHGLAVGRGLDVPVAGRLRAVSAAELLAGIADMDDDQVDAEVAAWLADRDEPDAAEQLVAAMRRHAQDIGCVSAGFRAMNALPRDRATAALASLHGDERLGPFVDAWEARHRVDREWTPQRLAMLLHAAVSLDGPAAVAEVLAGAGDASAQTAAVEALRAEGDTAAVSVLQAIGAHAADKAVAKAARRALFRLETARR